MEKVIFSPAYLSGSVDALPSKSDIHRALFCALLAKGKSVIEPIVFSNDIKATLACCEALGAKIIVNENSIEIDSKNAFEKKEDLEIFCNESGSTLRFIIPIVCANGVNATFTGAGLLPKRPLTVYESCLPQHGVICESNNSLPFSIKGQLSGGKFLVDGNISSQFITGLLLALPILKENSEIILTSPIESIGYINMTIDVMRKFGVEIKPTDNGFFIKGNQHYTPCNYHTQGDWSQAAFFLCAGALNGEVTVNNLDLSSLQGDKEIVDLLLRFGADITVDKENRSVSVVSDKKLRAIVADIKDIPDLAPVLSVVSACAEGETRIINAERLRIKECDRLNAMVTNLKAVGCDATELCDSMIVKGKSDIKGAFCEGYNDHRVVMSMAVAALVSDGDIEVSDPYAINKSYPGFFEDYNRLGGKANVVNVG